MKRLRITRGGQISVPADIRRRWGGSIVTLEDRGGVEDAEIEARRRVKA